MVSTSSIVRGISRSFYIPLYEKEMVKMKMKMKKTAIVKWIFERLTTELEAKESVLDDIKISIEEIDGEVYGKLEMFNVVRCDEGNEPIPNWQIDQPRKFEVHTDGWKLYFNEEMDDTP